MSNSHSYYQVGTKIDTGDTFYGFVRNLKVFKRLLNDNEIQQEAGKCIVWLYYKSEIPNKLLSKSFPKWIVHGLVDNF